MKCGRRETSYAARHAGSWRDGETRDIAKDMMRLTLAIAGKTLFDADVEHEAAEIGEALTTSLKAFNLALLPGARLIWQPKALSSGFESDLPVSNSSSATRKSWRSTRAMSEALSTRP